MASGYLVLRNSPIPITPQLFVVAAGRGDVHPDFENDYAVVDLRKLGNVSDPKDDQGKLLRLADAISRCIKQGDKILLVDEHGQNLVALVAALVLTAEGYSGPGAYSKVKNAIPGDTFQNKKYQPFLESLNPTAFKNLPPAPKRPTQTETTNDKNELLWTNHQGNN